MTTSSKVKQKHQLLVKLWKEKVWCGEQCYIEGKVKTVEDTLELSKKVRSRGHWTHKVREDGLYVVYGILHNDRDIEKAKRMRMLNLKNV